MIAIAGKQYIPVTPEVILTLRYGRIFKALLTDIMSLESEHFKNIKKRKRNDVIFLGTMSIIHVIKAIRNGLSAGDDLSTSSDAREILAFTPVPSPLTHIFHGLIGRLLGEVGSLLGQNLGDGCHEPRKMIRDCTKAAAVAAVAILIRPGQPKHKAIKLVTDALNEAGFLNPGRDAIPYSPKTIADWCKPRTRERGAYDSYYEDWATRFRGMRGRVGEGTPGGDICTDDDVDVQILFLVKSLPAAFSIGND